MRDGLLLGNITLSGDAPRYPAQRGDGERYGERYSVSRQSFPGSRQDIKLTFFKPRDYPDDIIRPLDYHVNPDFLESLIDNVNHARKDILKHGGFGALSGRDAYLNVASGMGETIMPSGNFYRFGRRNLNDMWRFVLVMTNMPSVGRTGIYNNRNHVTYTGWCLDEPVDERTGTLNPDCELVFTHFTHLLVDEKLDLGGHMRSFSPMSDCDILSVHTADLDSNRESERDFLIGPDNILSSINAIDDNDEIDSVAAPAEFNCLSRQGQNKPVRSVMNSPHRQLTRLLTATSAAVIGKEARELNVTPDMHLSYLDYNDHYANRRTLQSSLEENVPSRVSGPAFYKLHVLLRDLMHDYPGLEESTQIFEVVGGTFDRMDETRSDLISICSSYLKTAIPPILADHGISWTAFRYRTTNPKELWLSKAERQPLFELQGADPYLQESEEQTNLKMYMAYEYMRRTVFATIENMAGDIDVYVDHKSGAESIIHLQLPEAFEQVNPDPVIYQGELGGFISPQIGGMEEYERGEKMLNSVVDMLDTADQWKSGDADPPPRRDEDYRPNYWEQRDDRYPDRRSESSYLNDLSL